jgi:hypothetical protein
MTWRNQILIARFRTHASQRVSNMSQAVPDLSCLPTDSAKQDLFSCKATNEALAWEDILCVDFFPQGFGSV